MHFHEWNVLVSSRMKENTGFVSTRNPVNLCGITDIRDDRGHVLLRRVKIKLVRNFINGVFAMAEKRIAKKKQVAVKRIARDSVATVAPAVLAQMTIEMARRALRQSRFGWFRLLICLTMLLGLGFLAGQLQAWLVLVNQGVYVYSHPHSSFFYILTSLHAIHLCGGIIALLIVTVAALRLRITRSKRNAVDVTVMYWHFMDVLWIYLFVLLFFFRQ